MRSTSSNISESEKQGKPLHVDFVTGSLGSYMQVNPSIRLYKMDARNHIPIEMEVYEFNLD
jgi:hypothetical protein